MNTLSPSLFTQTGATKLIELGHRMTEDSTGRVWRYTLAGASTIGRGKIAVQATVDAQRINLGFSTAPAIGDKKATILLGTGAATRNFFQDGWLVVQDGLGEGRAYPIEGHDAIGASTAGVFKLKEALDTVSAVTVANVDILRNQYAGAVISVTDQADYVLGFPNVAITNAEYGWVQTYGPCAVWFDEAVANGAGLTTGTAVAGSVEMIDASGEILLGHVAGTAGVDDEYQMVDLSIKA